MFSHFLRKVCSFGWRVPAAARTIRTAGRRWHLTPDAADVIGQSGPDLDRWVADGSAEVVKSGPHRTVYRVTLPGGVVYVKHCRVGGFRAWAREVLRPAKARLEFENALTLRGSGVATILPVAWGGPDSPWPGESFLITRSLDGVVPFVTFVERVLPTLPPTVQCAVRRQLARALGQFLARLHDVGVAHPDPHPGNLLLELPPSLVPRFFLIDLHAVRIGRPLSWAESLANLVLFNRWFQIRAGRTDRLRFWHSYRRSRHTLPLPDADGNAGQARAVERGTAESNLRFWGGRVSRCLGKNRYYRKVQAGPVRGHVVRDLSEPFLKELLADPDAPFARPGTRVIKDSRTSTVAEIVIPTADGPRAAILKRINVRHWTDPARNRLRRSPALRSWVNGHALRDRLLPTPRPLAVLHRFRAGCPAEGYLLTEKVPDAIELPEAAKGLMARPPGERTRVVRTWACRLARTLRAMHDRAVSHRDLKGPNVLLAGGAANPAGAVPVLIDLVGVRVGKSVPFLRRAGELARLNVSFLASPVVTRGDLLRFLRAYLAAGARPGTDWKAWWKAIAAATAVKVAKNHRSGRPLA
ncbi:MAG: 3-deoxy-D-manno-octulosonic-acid kinase [Gemmataceae bacterium]|nr:3-deoxy-D-manno-octulosonic-acid kinase [Gemmataceae bacterium]